ncbi:MAG: DUF1302 domain-containing protein [Deferribacteres bacterium]|nr:DUF1302 domain-containing protein [Deferribacteres bacterium]
MLIVFFLLLSVFMVTPAPASEGAGDSLFEGFDDTAPLDSEDTPLPAKAFPVNLGGYVKLGAAYNFAHHAPEPGETDWRGLSRLRTELQIEADWRLKGWRLFASGKGWYDLAYALNGRSGYTPEVLNDYEEEIELREAYLQGTLGKALDLKIGRQIVVWGRSDNFRVTDILNPLDRREPGLTDIEDLRLPLVMTRLDYFRGDWSLALTALHEHRFDKLPAFGHDFYASSTRMPPEKLPARTLDNTGMAVELKGIFPGWDISFYGARIYNDQPTFVPASPVTIEHRRIMMAGVAAEIARGNFLYILEAAHFRGLRFMNDYGTDYNRTDLLAGIEYSGFYSTTVSFEIVNRHLHGFDSILKGSPELPVEDDLQAALRIDRKFMNDTLALKALFVSLGERAQRGAMQRLTATYAISDGLSVSGGVVFYESGRGLMQNAGDNDRCFVEIRYDF